MSLTRSNVLRSRITWAVNSRFKCDDNPLVAYRLDCWKMFNGMVMGTPGAPKRTIRPFAGDLSVLPDSAVRPLGSRLMDSQTGVRSRAGSRS